MGQWDMKPESPWTGQRLDEVRRETVEHIYGLVRVMSMPQ
jgi:hypothetical protein